jgi:hypothetical protein
MTAGRAALALGERTLVFAGVPRSGAAGNRPNRPLLRLWAAIKQQRGGCILASGLGVPSQKGGVR